MAALQCRCWQCLLWHIPDPGCPAAYVSFEEQSRPVVGTHSTAADDPTWTFGRSMSQFHSITSSARASSEGGTVMEPTGGPSRSNIPGGLYALPKTCQSGRHGRTPTEKAGVLATMTSLPLRQSIALKICIARPELR